MLTVGDLRRWVRENPGIPEDTVIAVYVPDYALLKTVRMQPLVRSLEPYAHEAVVFYGYDVPGNEGKV